MHSTGANIPPELFPLIIRSVPSQYHAAGFVLPNMRGDGDPLWRCSLVNVYWAQISRSIIYYSTKIRIESMEQAVQFRNLVMNTKNKRLTPFAELIGETTTRYSYIKRKDPPCWNHILLSLVPRLPVDKFGALEIFGQFPSFSPSLALKFQSHQWGIPKPFPPFAAPYRELRLQKLHFASFQHFTQFIRHFRRAEVLTFDCVTWGSTNMPPLALPRPRTSVLCKYTSVKDIEISRCPHSLLLWQSLYFGLNVFKTLSDREQELIDKMITGICDAYAKTRKDGDSRGPFINYSLTRGNGHGRDFLIEVVVSAKDGSSNIRLCFVCRTISEPDSPCPSSQLTACLIFCLPSYPGKRHLSKEYISHDFWSLILHLPFLQCLAIALSSANLVADLAEAHPEVCKSNDRQLRCHWILCQDTDGDTQWTRIDPSSLQLNDETWDNPANILKDFAKHLNYHCDLL